MRYIDVKVPQEANEMKVEQLFRDYLGFSKKQVHLLRMQKDCKRNGETVTFQDKVYTGDMLTLPIVENAISYTPYPMRIAVLYEDAHVLVVNKPKRLKVHPNMPTEMVTLCHGVANYLIQTNQVNDVRYVHRLDEDTTGAVIFAKHAYAHTLLDRALFDRKIQRLYGAICHHAFRKIEDVIDAPLGKDRMGKRCVTKQGQLAQTYYRVIRQNHSLSYVEFQLKTGRTHQIRIHCAHIGHPILGDSLYGGKPIEGFTSQALHAFSVSFYHPFDRHFIQIDCPYPSQFQKIMETLPKV